MSKNFSITEKNAFFDIAFMTISLLLSSGALGNPQHKICVCYKNPNTRGNFRAPF